MVGSKEVVMNNDANELKSVTILDLFTGESRIVDGVHEWHWMEGNASCDCNRAIYMYGDDIPEDPKAEPFLKEGTCDGLYRFLIVDAVGDFNDTNRTKAGFIKWANEEYYHYLREALIRNRG